MKNSIKIIIAFLLTVSCSQQWQEGNMASNGDWDGIIDNYKDCPDSVDVRNLCLLNVALAEKGELADKAFHYTQAGSAGLIPKWDRTYWIGALLSDVYYSAGHISMSQRFAFEAMICADGAYDEAMMKRLVQTNIIYGAYDIAEKYISRLEKDRSTREWAADQRRYLYDDSTVEADPQYGPRRNCIPQNDFVGYVRGIDQDLKDILRQNPSYQKAAQYLGMYYLLDCDFNGFRAFMDEFYGTESLKQLPRHFHEAACILSEMDHGYWRTVGVSADMHKQYRDFEKRYGSGLNVEKYKDTYWYYVIRVIVK